MQDTKAIYAELKPEIEILATLLFDVSKRCLRDLDGFLPHAAILNALGKPAIVAFKPENELTNAAEVLPGLHGMLRALAAKGKGLVAIGIAENVNITLPGQPATDAMKVLIEHRRGLTVALYVPFRKKLLRGYVFGDMVSMLATPEVNAWPTSPLASSDESSRTPAI
jgi:hypothetical protein